MLKRDRLLIFKTFSAYRAAMGSLAKQRKRSFWCGRPYSVQQEFVCFKALAWPKSDVAIIVGKYNLIFHDI